MSEATPLTVERWGWRSEDADTALVTLGARWAEGAPSGRVALVAQRGSDMIAFVLLPEGEASSEPFHVALCLPLAETQNARTAFRLKVEGGPSIRLDRPAREDPERRSISGSFAEGTDGTVFEGRDRSEGRRSAERRLRELERDLERERAGRQAMEAALQSADETGQALARVRSEGEELRYRLGALERARAALEEELAATRAAARAHEESARAGEAELAAVRAEAEAMGERLEAATRQIGELRESLAAEADARAGAEQASRAARKERDAAVERMRALKERDRTGARANALERALREAREEARSHRAERERLERDLDEARSRAPELAEWADRARSDGEERISSLTQLGAELGALAATPRLGAAAGERSPNGSSAASEPDEPRLDLDEALRAVARGRREAAALEGQVREMRSALLEFVS